MTKVAAPTAPHGHFSKDRFHLARLAAMGIGYRPGGWTVAAA